MHGNMNVNILMRLQYNGNYNYKYINFRRGFFYSFMVVNILLCLAAPEDILYNFLLNTYTYILNATRNTL